MSHVFFDPDQVNWSEILSVQQGGNSSRRYFAGTKHQRGFGALSSIGKFLLPIVKNLGMTVGTQGVEAGMNILKDLTEGKDLKESVVTHSNRGLSNIAQRVQQCGKGAKKKRNARKRDQLDLF